MNTHHLSKTEILNFLREKKDSLHQEFGVTKIALFGSYSRDEQTPESDIDLAIESKIITFDNRYNLRTFLEQFFSKKVDVCYLHSMRTFIRQEIDRDLIYDC
jgi:uncharacterized protein